ncbi:alpha-isopropylmalate synthase regulatory domain-containing protein, partial [Streptomyces sp. NPDC003032]
CTANGYGERVGNANLFPVVAALELKYDKRVLPPDALGKMTHISHAIAEIVNLAPSTHQPYVGVSAFAHKAGLHASAIKVDPDLYQHIAPDLVGNRMRMLVSDMAGRASIELKAKELGVDLGDDRDLVSRVVARVKEQERLGYTYEAADASFELLLREEVPDGLQRHFNIESWRIIAEDRPDGSHANEATVKLWAQGERIVAAAEGTGPVNAFDRALRAGLERIYPELTKLELVDYKVRILEEAHGTTSAARVLISTTDATGVWSTVGVGDNIIAASCQALEDAYTYGLLRAGVDATTCASECPSAGDVDAFPECAPAGEEGAVELVSVFGWASDVVCGVS